MSKQPTQFVSELGLEPVASSSLRLAAGTSAGKISTPVGESPNPGVQADPPKLFVVGYEVQTYICNSEPRCRFGSLLPCNKIRANLHCCSPVPGLTLCFEAASPHKAAGRSCQRASPKAPVLVKVLSRPLLRRFAAAPRPGFGQSTSGAVVLVRIRRGRCNSGARIHPCTRTGLNQRTCLAALAAVRGTLASTEATKRLTYGTRKGLIQFCAAGGAKKKPEVDLKKWL